MVSFTSTLLIILSAGTTLLQVNGYDDFACGDQQLIVSGKNNRVCCPGVGKTMDGKTYCCNGGNDDDHHDISSCKDAFDVDDSSYAENVQSKLGITVHTPKANSSGGSGSSKRAITEDTLILGAIFSLAAVSAAMLAF
ncbi:hypothetical protein F4814DRAFT_444141 [Daldinia grandis]|nr:hypothetical protein F4814DRAFT_444141 [Daldinia grandis]